MIFEFLGKILKLIRDNLPLVLAGLVALYLLHLNNGCNQRYKEKLEREYQEKVEKIEKTNKDLDQKKKECDDEYQKYIKLRDRFLRDYK